MSKKEEKIKLKEQNRKQKEEFKEEKQQIENKFASYRLGVKEEKKEISSSIKSEIESTKSEINELKDKDKENSKELSELKKEASNNSKDDSEENSKETDSRNKKIEELEKVSADNKENILTLNKKVKASKKEISARLRKGYYPVDSGIAIELKNAYKYYISSDVITKVIDDLSLKIKRDEVTIILGPSGSGKTTLLNLISGLDKPSAGNVITNNHNLSWIRERKLINFRKENISFIFQQYNLIPTLNIEDNIRTGYEIKNPDIEPIDIEELMKKINIWESRKKYPYQLSGGQLQRTAIARALAKNPDIIFADEPTGALDEDMSKEVLDILIDITKQYNKTLIIVTHNPQIAKIGNRVLRFGNGKIVKDEVNTKPTKPKDLKW